MNKQQSSEFSNHEKNLKQLLFYLEMCFFNFKFVRYLDLVIVMKKYHFIILIMIILFCWSCQKEEEIDFLPALRGTEWRFEGVIDARRGEKELEPNNIEIHNILKFLDKDSILHAGSIDFIIIAVGMPESLLKNVISTGLNSAYMTSTSYIGGIPFLEALFQVSSYTFINNELRFYYHNKKKFLLYKPYKSINQ